jgi:hypothetical protein
LEYVWVVLLGGLVGAGEIVSRYRDQPSAPFRSPVGWSYVLLNSAAACLGLWLLHTFKVQFVAKDKSEIQTTLTVLVAGLGAMTILRSSVFSLRVGDRDVNVGGAALLQVFLDAADRSIDRTRAAARTAEVARFMAGLDFNRTLNTLPQLCMALMQSFPPQLRETLAQDVARIGALGPAVADAAKLQMLGLILMNYFGSQVVERAVANLGGSIK